MAEIIKPSFPNHHKSDDLKQIEQEIVHSFDVWRTSDKTAGVVMYRSEEKGNRVYLVDVGSTHTSRQEDFEIDLLTTSHPPIKEIWNLGDFAFLWKIPFRDLLERIRAENPWK